MAIRAGWKREVYAMFSIIFREAVEAADKRGERGLMHLAAWDGSGPEVPAVDYGHPFNYSRKDSPQIALSLAASIRLGTPITLPYTRMKDPNTLKNIQKRLLP
jgi:hypothetical protein